MKMEKRKITLGKSKLRYLKAGSGKPLLFIHGWPASPNAHRPVIELLAQKFSVHAPFIFDQKCKNIAEMARCMEDFMEKTGMQNAIVVGNSYGGVVGSALARDKNLVEKLVLVNTAGLPRNASLRKMFYNLLRSSAQMASRGDISNLFGRLSSSVEFAVSLGSNRRRSLFAEIRTSSKVHACYLFKSVKAKTTIIACKEDDVSLPENSQILKEMVKGSKLILVEGDHYWAFNNPKHYSETIAKALTD